MATLASTTGSLARLAVSGKGDQRYFAIQASPKWLSLGRLASTGTGRSGWATTYDLAPSCPHSPLSRYGWYLRDTELDTRYGWLWLPFWGEVDSLR